MMRGGRYWVRTSDLFGVNEARYHCANRPLSCGGNSNACAPAASHRESAHGSWSAASRTRHSPHRLGHRPDVAASVVPAGDGLRVAGGRREEHLACVLAHDLHRFVDLDGAAPLDDQRAGDAGEAAARPASAYAARRRRRRRRWSRCPRTGAPAGWRRSPRWRRARGRRRGRRRSRRTTSTSPRPARRARCAARALSRTGRLRPAAQGSDGDDQRGRLRRRGPSRGERARRCR